MLAGLCVCVQLLVAYRDTHTHSHTASTIPESLYKQMEGKGHQEEGPATQICYKDRERERERERESGGSLRPFVKKGIIKKRGRVKS